jgi:hypothetical protein
MVVITITIYNAANTCVMCRAPPLCYPGFLWCGRGGAPAWRPGTRRWRRRSRAWPGAVLRSLDPGKCPPQDGTQTKTGNIPITSGIYPLYNDNKVRSADILFTLSLIFSFYRQVCTYMLRHFILTKYTQVPLSRKM